MLIEGQCTIGVKAALCSNRLRQKNCISHHGFELPNGMGFLVTDEQVYHLLAARAISQAVELKQSLSLIRMNLGH